MLYRILATLPLVAGAALQWPFESPESSGNGLKVNVTLNVMSRCPDARICESIFEEVFKTKSISNKVDLSMQYIGSTNSSESLGVSCKHGESECIGNAHQLCLHKHLSLDTFYANIACQNYQDFPGKIGTLALTKQCASAAKVDWEASGVGKCIEGKQGKRKDGKLGKEARKLLKKNIKATARTGIKTSCTVVIDSTLVKGGNRTCVVDGGVWKGCDDGHTAADFVRVIEAEYKSLQSPKTDQVSDV